MKHPNLALLGCILSGLIVGWLFGIIAAYTGTNQLGIFLITIGVAFLTVLFAGLLVDRWRGWHKHELHVVWVDGHIVGLACRRCTWPARRP